MRDIPDKPPLPLITIQAHGKGVSAVAWTPNGSRLATSSGFIHLGATNDLSIRIWDAETGQLIITLEGQTQPVRRVSWSPDGSRLASAGLDGTVRIWGN
jgi:WD40 repeat protein